MKEMEIEIKRQSRLLLYSKQKNLNTDMKYYSFIYDEYPIQTSAIYRDSQDIAEIDYFRISHLRLKGSKIRMKSTFQTDLRGYINVDSNGVPKTPIQPIKSSSFSYYRKIFKEVAKVMKLYNKVDAGILNSINTGDKIELDDERSDIFIMLGHQLYDVIKEYFNDRTKNVVYIKKDLKPILETYNRMNSSEELLREEIFDDLPYKINDSDTSSYDESDIQKEIPVYFQSQLDIIINDENDDSDSDFLLEEEEEEEETYNEEEEYREYSDEEDDDNQFYFFDYTYQWQNRIQLLNANEILASAKQKIQGNKHQDQKNEKKSNIRYNLKHDYLVDYVRRKSRFKSIREFANQWYKENFGDNVIPTSAVNRYKQIINKGPKKQNYISLSSLSHWAIAFDKLSGDEQKRILNNNPSPTHQTWGGARYTKVNENALLCLICLCLDFPNFPNRTYARYLNSKYGPCHENPIAKRTISRWLKLVCFSVKKVSFAPPSRNTFGARVYRVAWSLIIEELSKLPDVIICFIDEAGLTLASGNKYGKSFVGVTPLVNSPLSKAKVSILALVIPCFGVIYKYIEKSVLGDHYSDFLKECTDFLRRFIVDNTTEIVIIEDNCQIHKTSEVENTISTLQICVLPIVPYSPALNSVVEGYFGIMKGNQINSSYQEQHEKHLFVYQIEKQWNKTTKLLFTIEKQEKLYAEWLTRLHACIQGKPLFTGHVNRDTTDSYLEKLRSFKTYRSLSIINSDSQQEGS